MSKSKALPAAESLDVSGSQPLAPNVAFGNPAGQPGEVLTLDLSDLLRDSNGEIVLFNDSHLPALAVRVDRPPIESGEIGSHVTEAGDDVTGYRFVAFDNGTKLFYQDSLDLVILGASGDLHG